jgi:hypothetical protein
MGDRRMIENPYLDGVYSAEFEESTHAALFEELAGFLFNAVTREKTPSYDVEGSVHSKVRKSGIQGEIY